MEEPRRILVVKLGALGNVILSLAPFATIRRHHPAARITLLTTAPFAGWLARAPWFDDIWIDERPDWWELGAWLRLRRRLVGGRFDRVYDLQTSGRSGRYFRLLTGRNRPDWSGNVAGCSLPDRDPDRDRLHDIDRQFGQLRQAGITAQQPVDLSWSSGDIGGFALPARFALLAPGSSPHRPVKRWPVQHYQDLATRLVHLGLTPVVVGTAHERTLAQAIPAAIDLTGRTDLSQLTSLARAASIAIGNDTGPMHLTAAAGCPSIVLFSRDSDPAQCAPRGAAVLVLRRPDLAALDVATVRDSVLALLPAPALAN
ncbi:MAG: glycosyltransferase family 9 protein [Acetobacteraceae bacterium]